VPGALMDPALRLIEAMLFAAAEPLPITVLSAALDADAAPVLATLRDRYAGGGVELHQVAGGWQLRTAPDLAPALTHVVPAPRRLPRAAMEALAVIAYHQPATRAEMEAVRGVSIAQSSMDLLLELGLVATAGRRESPGRPTLWVTTPAFLAQFGLQSLRDLPPRSELTLPG